MTTVNLVNPFGAAAAPGGTHQYWEFVTLAGGAHTKVLAELEVRETVGGANIISSATLSAGASFGFGGVWANLANIVDGNTATTGICNGTAGTQYGGALRITFPSPQKLAEISVHVGANPLTMTAFMFRGSDDLSTWKTYLLVPQETWSSQPKAFALGVALPSSGRANARAWRVKPNVSMGAAAYYACRALEFRPSISGSNLSLLANGNLGTRASNGTPICSGTSTNPSQFNMEKAFDATFSTLWAHEAGTAGTPVQDAFIGWLFETKQDIAEVSFQCQSTLYVTTEAIVQYSTDMNSWTTAYNTGTISWTADETKVWDVR